MAKVRSLSVLLCISLLANLFFVATVAFYATYVRKHGGLAGLFGPAPIKLNTTLPSLVRKSLFESLQASSTDSPSVFLGDSLTEFCEWDELMGAPALNRGISSDTTLDVLNRLGPVLALHPKAIYLMIGINDGVERSSVADAAARYQQILQKIRKASPTTTIYIESVLPVRSSGFLVQALGDNRGPELNRWVAEMNRAISNYADGKSILYVDVHDDLLENSELAARYTVDGIHLSGAGYAVWRQRLLPFLSRP